MGSKFEGGIFEMTKRKFISPFILAAFIFILGSALSIDLYWIAVDSQMSGHSVLILLGGLMIPALAALLIFNILGYARKVERKVKERTLELSQINQRLEKEIDERKLAEESFRTNEERFRSLVINIPGVIYRCSADKERTMQFISQEIETLVGFPAGDFINHKRTFASVIHPEDRKLAEDTVLKAIEGKNPFVIEYRVIHAHGKIKWVYEKGQGIFAASGELQGLDGAIFDITERRRLSEQFMQSQKMDAVGKLAGGVAHDFNNQIMVMMGFCEMILSDMAEGNPHQAAIKEIKNAAERSAAITRQLLTFSRREIVQPKIFDPNVLIRDLERMFNRLLFEDIKLMTTYDVSAGFIKMDPSQLEQVVMNLVVNARDAMIGGGTLKIQTGRASLKLGDPALPSGIPGGEYVTICVSDTGIGMTEEVKKHLFEPFFTTKVKEKGTGLGLATSYGIVERCHGFIRVESKPGEGSNFILYFPSSLEAVELLVVQKRAPQLPEGNETILVIEDEEPVRRLAAAILSKQGYKVLEAASGIEALQIVKSTQEKISLILADVVMPKMNGREAADHIRYISPETKVIFMSGYTDDVIVRHGVKAAQLNYLQKPFTQRVLAFKVREVLDGVIKPA